MSGAYPTPVTGTQVKDTATAPPNGFDERVTLTAYIARFAATTPDMPAIVDGDSVTTYAELDRRSAMIANAVRGRVEAGDSPVAAVVGHGVEGLVAILGIMRSGRPLVQLDPMIPTARLETMYGLSRARLIVTDAAHRLVVESLSPPADAVLLVEDASDPTPPPPVDDPSAVGCIFFTSGSTGVPKGVPWENRMLAYEAWLGIEAVEFSPADRIALVLPFSFSAGMGVVTWALTTGAALHLFDPRMRPVGELVDWLTTQRITTMHSTPSLLRSLLATIPADRVLADLRIVMTCAEPVHGKEIAALRGHLPADASYVNWTGASEAGTLALNRVTATDPLPDGVIPTGRPVPEKNVQVTTSDGGIAEPGETGELVVHSRYICGSYWLDEKRSAAKFGRTPEGLRLYRMGDLGRRSVDGVIELAGRADNALKIRGYLVEPIEVEAALLEIDQINDAAVVGEKRADGGTRLIAYVAMPPASRLSPAAIRKQVRAKLPEWSVPSVIMQLDALPRTERGKVDRQALPRAPEGPQAGFVAPRTPWEISVAEIWSRTLHLAEIGIHDDFTELGGNSLAAQEILALTASELNLRLPSAALLEAPTIAEFAALVQHSATAGGTRTADGQAVDGADRRWDHIPTLIPLKPTGSLPPIFCFAGAGGLAMTFLPLVRRLGEDQPAWGLQEQGLENRGLPDWSVGRSVQRHLKTIRAIQPHGPYILIGYSFGGLVAYETGRRLREAGEEVALVVTLDTALPGTIFRPPATTEPRPTLVETLQKSRGNEENTTGAAKVLNPALNLVDRVRRSERPVVKILRNSYRLPFAGLVRFAGTDHYDVFFCKGMVAGQYYRMRPSANRTLVFVAKNNVEEFDNTRFHELLTGTWRIQHIAGDHHSIWREPHVNELAEVLRQEIQEIKCAG